MITSTITNNESRSNNLNSEIGNRQCHGGEGGIRTLGSLLGYGALAKRCFRPLSHLTKIEREYCGESGFSNLQFGVTDNDVACSRFYRSCQALNHEACRIESYRR